MQLEDLEGKRGKAVQDKFEEPADEKKETENKKKPLPQPVESVPARAPTPPPKRKKKNLGALKAMTPTDTATNSTTASSSLRKPKFSKPAHLQHSPPPLPPSPETAPKQPKPLPPPLTSADDFNTDSAFSPHGESEDEGPLPPGDFTPSFFPLHANPNAPSKYCVKVRACEELSDDVHSRHFVRNVVNDLLLHRF